MRNSENKAMELPVKEETVISVEEAEVSGIVISRGR